AHAVAEERCNLLSLPDPLSALRQRQAIHFAHQLRSKIVEAYPHQAGALAQCPGVAGMIAEIFGDLETSDEVGNRTDGRSFSLGHRDCGLDNNCLAAVEVIDQQESCECEENQNDCHNPPSFEGSFFFRPLATIAKGIHLAKLTRDFDK